MIRRICANVLFLSWFLFPYIAYGSGGSLYVYPSYGAYAVGDVFDIKLLVDSGGEAINAAEAEMHFDPTGLFAESIAIEGSIMDSWPTKPAFSNDAGTIRFAGWTNERFIGEGGLLITVRFRALRATRSNARLAAGAILSADGRGSNIITSLKSGVYNIEPKQIIGEKLSPEPEAAASAEPTIDESAALPEIAPSPRPRFENVKDSLVPGERIVAQGAYLPNTRVFVSIEKEGLPPKKIALTSAPDGSFIFAGETATEGVYRLWAEADNGGAGGQRSETITIRVQSEGFAAAIASVAGIASAALPLIALLLAAGLAGGYLLHRHKVERIKLLAAHAREDHRQI